MIRILWQVRAAETSSEASSETMTLILSTSALDEEEFNKKWRKGNLVEGPRFTTDFRGTKRIIVRHGSDRIKYVVLDVRTEGPRKIVALAPVMELNYDFAETHRYKSE